jgi:hypothetical protein
MAHPTIPTDDFSGWTQEQLLEEVEVWSDQYREGEAGYLEPVHATWTADNHYPLSLIAPTPEKRQDWIEFIDAEVKMWAEEGEPDRFDDLLDGEIHTHVVILVRDGEHYVWDGNHRVGAAIKAGATTIPAIIGVPMSELEIQEKFAATPDSKVSSGLSM